MHSHADQVYCTVVQNRLPKTRDFLWVGLHCASCAEGHSMAWPSSPLETAAWPRRIPYRTGPVLLGAVRCVAPDADTLNRKHLRSAGAADRAVGLQGRVGPATGGQGQGYTTAARRAQPSTDKRNGLAGAGHGHIGTQSNMEADQTSVWRRHLFGLQCPLTCKPGRPGQALCSGPDPLLKVRSHVSEVVWRKSVRKSALLKRGKSVATCGEGPTPLPPCCAPCPHLPPFPAHC